MCLCVLYKSVVLHKLLFYLVNLCLFGHCLCVFFQSVFAHTLLLYVCVLSMRKCVSLCQGVLILMVRCVKAIACILHVCLLQMVIISISISITLKSLIWIFYNLHGEHIEQQALSSFFGLGNWPFLVRICFRKPLLGRYPWMQGAKMNTFWVDLIHINCSEFHIESCHPLHC